MVLPFVREFFADLEKISAFARAVSHLKPGAGRAGVSGLTLTAKALLIALLQRSAARRLIVVVSSNRAMEELLPVVQACCELTGGAAPEAVVALPTRDVLPFQNLSPHPEIQEARATALWKIATGEAEIVLTPVVGSAMFLRSADYYADQARVARRGEPLDVNDLVQHLNTVGYTRADVVEMPGEYALRGGILDVYSPESDRPLRLELFGDEVESIRKFDPATQRSSASVDEAVLLPLTDTPVTEEVLAAIHARLSGKRLAGTEQSIEEAVRAGGVTVFPGWEFYAPLAASSSAVGDQSPQPSTGTLFELMPDAALLILEPSEVTDELDHVWDRVEQIHERSGIGKLVRPEDLYLSPEAWKQRTAGIAGLDLEHLGFSTATAVLVPDDVEPPLGAVGDESNDNLALHLNSQPAMRFHGSVTAMVE